MFFLPGTLACPWLKDLSYPSAFSHAPRAQGTFGGCCPNCLFYDLLRIRFPLLPRASYALIGHDLPNTIRRIVVTSLAACLHMKQAPILPTELSRVHNNATGACQLLIKPHTIWHMPRGNEDLYYILFEKHGFQISCTTQHF